MIKEPPLLTIRRNFPRPPRALIEKLKGAQTVHIADAQMGRAALDSGIKPVDPECSQFVGPALTCQPGADDNLAILAALALAEPGDVIVATADAFSTTAVVGDNVTMMAKNKGVVAIVIDGMARDTYGIVPVGLPVFSRGITPNSCVKSGPGRVGLPIVCGGVAIAPGDVVLGDRDGVVVILQLQLEAVTSQLDEIRRLEEETQANIRAGLTHPPSIDALLRSDKVHYLD
jgi:4-hydroxy-4-methyl-2-oxoglutarate aldolase